MGPGKLGILILALTAGGQPPAGQNNYYAAATAAARELSNQLFYLQRGLATIPGPPEGRGFYKQIERAQLDLTYLQQQIQRKVPRESLYLAFDPLNTKVNQFLNDIQNAEKWAPFLGYAARRARAAQYDLRLALAAGDGAPERQSEMKYLQILVILTRTEDLDGMVRYVLDGQDSLAGWKTDFAKLHQALKESQRLQKSKAAPATVKTQINETIAVWNKMLAKYNSLPEYQGVLLRSDFATVDLAFFRLAALYGIKKNPSQ
jgi:hypothetical protein